MGHWADDPDDGESLAGHHRTQGERQKRGSPRRIHPTGSYATYLSEPGPSSGQMTSRRAKRFVRAHPLWEEDKLTSAESASIAISPRRSTLREMLIVLEILRSQKALARPWPSSSLGRRGCVSTERRTPGAAGRVQGMRVCEGTSVRSTRISATASIPAGG